MAPLTPRVSSSARSRWNIPPTAMRLTPLPAPLFAASPALAAGSPGDVTGSILQMLLGLVVIIGLLVGVGPMLIGFLLGPRRPDPEKLSPYECGFEAFEDARMKFDVRYYLVAILFILFDLEIAFLFPWAVVLKEIGMFGFVAMMIFLGILVVGFVYEWKKGALDWE